MPELPEVEIYRRYFEAVALDRPLAGLEVEDERQLKAPIADVRKALRGTRFAHTERIGKYLFAVTARGPVLVIHFGMTGGLHYYARPADAPRFNRLVLVFSGGERLAITDPRKFARLDLADSVAAYQQYKRLSDDALRVTAEALANRLQNRKAPIKAVLLDQKVTAGIGNWIADEVLFQARIHPATRAHTLDQAQVAALAEATRDVLETAIRHEAIYTDFPDRYLIRNRWEQPEDRTPASQTELSCPRCTRPLVRDTVAGRTTFWCSGCQPLADTHAT